MECLIREKKGFSFLFFPLIRVLEELMKKCWGKGRLFGGFNFKWKGLSLKRVIYFTGYLRKNQMKTKMVIKHDNS